MFVKYLVFLKKYCIWFGTAKLFCQIFAKVLFSKNSSAFRKDHRSFSRTARFPKNNVVFHELAWFSKFPHPQLPSGRNLLTIRPVSSVMFVFSEFPLHNNKFLNIMFGSQHFMLRFYFYLFYAVI